MQTFLHSIASAYSDRYTDLSGFCFVFPNKRSGSFFMRSLADIWETPRISPEVTTISDLAVSISGRLADNRLDLLFKLFECYADLLSRPDGGKADVDFDRFRSWGDTVLSDFNEVDMQLVDVSAIFKNVKDLREINTDFLTEEQKSVMQEYFGYLPDREEDSFWKTFSEIDLAEEDDGPADGLQDGPDDRNGTPHRGHTKKRFLHLWRILGPLYRRLEKRLEAEGLATTGGTYRLAARRLEEGEEPDYIRGRKFVFIGFNALTMAERHIMAALAGRQVTIDGSEECGADFFWDLSGPLLSAANLPATRFVASNRRRFPEPSWSRPYLEASEPKTLPEEISVIAVPSNSQQVKIISRLIADAVADSASPGFISEEDITEARAAVVLPDEQMLLPMLSSMPEGVESINLTMGYPLRLTPVVSFINIIRRMQQRQRKVGGRMEFFFDDVCLFLSHPYSQAIYGSRLINGFLVSHRRHKHITVHQEELEGLATRDSVILTPVAKDCPPLEVIRYMDAVLDKAESSLPSDGATGLKRRIEHSNIDSYRQALVRLAECLSRYGTEMSRDTVFLLADRLIAAETVTFEGEPLRGLQIMGMLETRALDFDHIFIPGVEDKKLPRRGRTRTFIPNAIRQGYGMPPANYQEEMFAYYFFRLIGRGKRVVLTYDSRTGNARGGGISRFILQLRYLLTKGHIKEEAATFPLHKRETAVRPAEKDDFTMSRLGAFCNSTGKGDTLNFSASALSSYTKCPREFFLKYVCGCKDDPEETETISPITHGDIVHATMLELYLPDPAEQKRLLDTPKVITRGYIDGLLADRESLKRVLYRQVNRHHFNYSDPADLDRPLTGSAELVAPVILRQVENILAHDAALTPFTLYGAEIKRKFTYPLSDGRMVNVSLAIDRLDGISGKDGEEILRIVDYKTGNVHLKADRKESIFNGDRSATNILQLMFYARMLEHMMATDSAIRLPYNPDLGIRLEIYNVPKIMNARPDERYPKIEKKIVESHLDYAGFFRDGLDAMLIEILNPEIPFRGASNPRDCANCRLFTYCQG